jgi:predicted membrane-bound spermidine synthase
MTDARTAPSRLPLGLLHAVFFLSGLSALLYQLIWQRLLFTIYGTSAESVTLVVTAFMLGLGVGALAGGWLSERPRVVLPLVFGLVELGIGAFGLLSLPLFRWVASFTSGARGLEVGLCSLALVVLPTGLMGTTLPLLVAHRVRETKNVGQTVGRLYSINTLGSAAGAFAAVSVVLPLWGQSSGVRLAAGLNFAVAALVLGTLFFPRSR